MADVKPPEPADGRADVSKADYGVWLMKVPRALAGEWQAPGPGGGQEVGRIRMQFDPLQGTDATEFMLQLTARADAAAARPGKYRLNYVPDHIPMHVFSESQQGKVVVEGKVENKFDLQPITDDRTYRAIVSDREKKYSTPKRQLQVWQGGTGHVTVPLPGDNLAAFNKDKRKPQAAAVRPFENKRVRMERADLEPLLFRLFEEQPSWSLKQLVETTNQPNQYIKEVLNELCTFNKRGASQGTWTLRPEYRKTVRKEGDAEPGP